ncbi:hypothetical protein KA005_52200 [bacterium]|nr:hypothetical protein [bacterium]
MIKTRRLQISSNILRCCWFCRIVGIYIVGCLLLFAIIPSLPLAKELSAYSYHMSLKRSIQPLLPGQLVILPLKIKNTSGLKWSYSSEHPINLSYHWLNGNGDVVIYDGERTPVPQGFRNGILRAKVRAPQKAGDYFLEFDLVHEHVTWFAQSGASPLRIPVRIRESVFLLQDRHLIRKDQKTAWWCDVTEINQIQHLIKATLEANTRMFIGLSGPVFGFTAGLTYPQLWIRDLSTIISMARYYYDKDYLGSWIDEYLYFQNKDGSVYDWIDSRGLCDKNSVESDQESSLIIAAFFYYLVTQDKQWLQERIQKLESVLNYILNNRRDGKTDLIWSGYTADWGDISPAYNDQRAIYYDSNTPKVVGLYTNALFCRAAQKLALLFNVLGNVEKYKQWQRIAETWKNKVNALFWSENFYRMHGYILSPAKEIKRLNISQSIFPLGGNAEAMLAGIPDETQVRAIYEEAKQRQGEYSISTIAAVLLPPFPRNFFEHPAMKNPFSYQNGGQWDWFAGRFVLGLFQYDLVQEATSELIDIARKVNRNEGFYEWDTPKGVGKGSPYYAGGAAVVGRTIVEGLFGVSYEQKGWALNIRLGDHEGEIKVYEPSTRSSIYYHYRPGEVRIDLIFDTQNLNQSPTLKIWKPAGPWKVLFVNDNKTQYLQKNENGQWYYVLAKWRMQ